MKTIHALCAALLGAAVLAAAGCSSTPTRYYSLAEGAAPGPAPAQAPGAAPPLLEFAPVALPERLARPQLVVRQKDREAGPQVLVLEQHRWASSFESEVRDALGSAVAARLGGLDVTRSGRQAGQPVTRIALQVQQFDAIEGSRVEAAFGWTLRRSGDGPTVGCTLALSEPVDAGLDALAGGARRLVSRLADAVAASMPALQGQPGAGCRPVLPA
jgi:uncharacterized lipoprotein YmbA